MVDWHKFDVAEYQLELNEDKLAAHGIDADEALEVLWNGFEVRRNKASRDRYQIVGRTDAGRILKLIVHDTGKKTLRIITGWSL